MISVKLTATKLWN